MLVKKKTEQAGFGPVAMDLQPLVRGWAIWAILTLGSSS